MLISIELRSSLIQTFKKQFRYPVLVSLGLVTDGGMQMVNSNETRAQEQQE